MDGGVARLTIQMPSSTSLMPARGPAKTVEVLMRLRCMPMRPPGPRAAALEEEALEGGDGGVFAGGAERFAEQHGAAKLAR